MHRVSKSHLKGFVENHSLEAEDEATQFEKFVNFAVITNETSSRFELDDVTTGASENGIDGVAIIIDEDVVVSAEDASAIFSETRRNHDVQIVFTQAKRSEKFDLGDFLKFKEAVLCFVDAQDYSSVDEVLKNAREMFDVVVDNVSKIRGGKPSLTGCFVTAGTYNKPRELEAALSSFRKDLAASGIFAETDVRFVDRDELTKLWVSTYSETEARLELFSSAALPIIAGIDEAYLAVVKASNFVENLLLMPDGNLRTQVFEENVRSYLGEDNAVNQSIALTLKSDTASRFPVLNNGITIVSPDVRLQGNTLHLKNYQIINGCQTSNVLFENRGQLDDIMVNVKVVETKNEDVFSELVRATNSQSQISNSQFLSLRPIIKKIEQYFNTFENESRLYFERRERQYVGQNIPAIRIFSVHDAAKCVTAMYCRRPELSYRYPKQMYKELADKLFANDTKESIFYASCLTLYRLTLLISNKTLPQNMSRFKWHMLPIAEAIICDKKMNML